MANKSLVLMFTILLFANGVFIVSASPAFQDGLESKDWPTAIGTILSSYILTKEEYTDDDYGPSYSARVTYDFEVMGRIYESDKIHVRKIEDFSFWDSDRSKAQKIVDKYLLGNKVTVYYDADNPNNCALEPGLHFGNYFLFLLSMIFFIILVFLIFVFKPVIFRID